MFLYRDTMENYHCGGRSAQEPSWTSNVSKIQTFLPELSVSGGPCFYEADSLQQTDIFQTKDKVCKQTWEVIAHFLWRTRWVRIIYLSDSFRNSLGSKSYVLNRALLNCQEGKLSFCIGGRLRGNSVCTLSAPGPSWISNVSSIFFNWFFCF